MPEQTDSPAAEKKADESIIHIRPQEGPQTRFLSTDADIAILGGSAGGGKTFGLLLEALRGIGNPGYGAVIFRRTTPQITNEGGLWDTSEDVYGRCGGIPIESRLRWDFQSGARIKFSHLEYDKDRFAWQGAQIVFLGWDELTHFSPKQFWYMFSRLRSTCGIRPYIRATTNPDPDSFVAGLIAWWIDPETGLSIPERSGIKRWFVRENDELIWADTPEELLKSNPKCDPKSLTFISSKVYDNKILLAKNPEYLSNLKALSYVERCRLLDGNWKVRPTSGTYFKKEYFEIVSAAPADACRVRYWDRAGTAAPEEVSGDSAKASGNDPDRTAGVKMALDSKGIYYIDDVVCFQGTPLTVERTIKNTASQDGIECQIGLEQDPGQAGKAEVGYHIRNLSGYNVIAVPVHKDKITRASPFSAQCEAGNVKLVRGPWNEKYIDELINFPPPKNGGHDDQVDASSGAFTMLTKPKKGLIF